jgi:molybdate transport system ATP-binding protein
MFGLKGWGIFRFYPGARKQWYTNVFRRAFRFGVRSFRNDCLQRVNRLGWIAKNRFGKSEVIKKGQKLFCSLFEILTAKCNDFRFEKRDTFFAKLLHEHEKNQSVFILSLLMMIWQDVTIKIRTTLILKSIGFEIKRGQAVGIIGVNGSGKTILSRAIAGELAVSGNITENTFAKKKFVPFHSSLSMLNGHAVYRQQRWNKIETELLPKVKDDIKTENHDKTVDLLAKFGLKHFEDSFIINLSNGEQRKLELVKALSSEPDLLVLDNAYTGLDKNARNLLTQMLEVLNQHGQTLVMTGLTLKDFPPLVKQFIVLDKNGRVQNVSRKNLKNNSENKLHFGDESFPWPRWNYNELVYLNKVTLQYGDKTILKDISWKINAGERWVLSGPNGSGKTSLLNLIFGDNPKAYGCDIRLFGRQKGTGESIWDIKEKIGFISPELHQHIHHKQPVLNVISSGFNDTERSYRQPTGYQRDVAFRWLKKLGYSCISERLFGALSTSEQRIVLILRTLVKQPPLLILDEPFQGLDDAHIVALKSLLNEISAHSDCAMIFVTHLPEEIPECFTFHLKLEEGRMLEQQ